MQLNPWSLFLQGTNERKTDELDPFPPTSAVSLEERFPTFPFPIPSEKQKRPPTVKWIMPYNFTPGIEALTFDKDCQEFCITALQLSIPSLACSFQLTKDSLCADFQANISAYLIHAF